MACSFCHNCAIVEKTLYLLLHITFIYVKASMVQLRKTSKKMEFYQWIYKL